MSDDRKWWPMEWADEVMPPARACPDDFIIKTSDGEYFLGYAFDAKDATDSEKRTFSRKIDCGDIVEFLCCDPLGAVDVRIMPDGTWTASDPIPERATHFWANGDSDTLADTMDAFVAIYLECEPTSVSQERTETVSMAWWSEGLPHKFTLTYSEPELKASFVAASAAEAKQ